MKGSFCSFFASLAALVLSALPGAGQEYGFDAGSAIGSYLNGVFPSSTPGPTGAWGLTDAFPNLTFVDPVRVTLDPTGESFLYVVCRNGEIWKVPNDRNATTAQRVRFLDRRSTTWGYWDCGMLSLTFHPDFGKAGDPDRGYVYVFYQYAPDGGGTSVSSPSYMRLSRFTVPDGANQVDSNSEYVLIQQFDRHNWHNGGQSFFGADGFLYIAMGDEGDANDSYNVAQRLDNRLFSGIMRIDVDRNATRSHPIRRQPVAMSGRPAGWPASFTQGYYIPNDNPWLDANGGLLEEYWSLGLRSPHSLHYDKTNGNIWLAEIGQGAREEVTLARKGGNHQWPFKEGSINGPKVRPNPLIGTENPPIYDYGRTQGGCVIGGMVYYGGLHANALTGKYLFGDHNTRAIWAMSYNPGQTPQIEYLTSVFRSGGDKRGLSGISPGPGGEAYICELGDNGTNTGKVYILTRAGSSAGEPPALLSQTGAFSDLSSLTPRSGLLPYDLNAPLWSDNAEKRRWIAIPNDGTHNTSTEQISFSETGNWSFPIGTVIVKHFELPVDERNPSVVKRLETRFLVKGSDGKYYGVTYKWNAAGTDATLLSAGLEENVTVTLSNGSTRQQTWSYPSRSDCLTCHNTNAGSVLGLRTHQINRDVFFTGSQRTDNQLRAWNHIGLFSPSLDEFAIPGYAKSAHISDATRPLIDRVRSWIDSNCSQCHQPGGVLASFDARYTTPFAQQGLLNGPVIGTYGVSSPAVVKPADLSRSILYQRDNSLGSDAMPPLAKNLVHHEAMAVMAEWINSLDSGGDGVAPSARYVLLQADSEVNGNPWTSAAEINVLDGAGNLINRSGWTVTADSEEITAEDGRANNVLDGNANTIWHTEWSATSPAHPHLITIDLGVSRQISGLRYLPRQDASNGRIAGYKVFLSNDRQNWGAAVASGVFGDSALERTVTFSLVPGTSGLTGTYYAGQSFDSFLLQRSDAKIDFDWGSGSPASGVPPDQFSVRWTGNLIPSFGETYTFYTTTDDGVRLWVDGNLVINRWVDQSPTEASGSISLAAGVPVPIVMEYYENGGGAVAKLAWSSPRTAKGIIPEAAFIAPTGGEAPSVVLSTGSTTINGPTEVVVDFSKSVTGLSPADFLTSNANVTSLSGSGKTYIVQMTPLVPGVVTISLPSNGAFDGNGRGNTPSNELVLNYVDGGGFGDALLSVTLPTIVRSSSSATVSVTYEASERRSLQIILHDVQDGWRSDAYLILPVEAGQRTETFDLPVEPLARLGDGYLWVVRLLPEGGSFDQPLDVAYQEASMQSGGGAVDALDRVGVPSTLRRGETAVIEVDYRSQGDREIQLILHDAQDNWRVVGEGYASVTAGQGTKTFNLNVASDARVGDGYLWAARLIPSGLDFTQAVAERYINASVEPGGGGVATQDGIINVSAPTIVSRGNAVQVSVQYEATVPRDLNVVLLDANDNWRLVGEARNQVDAGIAGRDFTIGIASDARLGDGYVWVAQLLPLGSTDASGALDQKYVNATVEDQSANPLVNFAVLPDAVSSQSSVYGSAFTSNLAHDGNIDGDWRNGSVSHSELDSQAWWEIDLGSSRPVNHLLLWNRTDCCGERLSDFYVLLSDEPFASTDLTATLGQSGVEAHYFADAPNPTLRVDVGHGVRYVRVQLAGQGYLSLAEVEVLGSLGGGLVNGLTYHYYEGVWDNLPDFSSIPVRETGTVGNFVLSIRNRDDYFALRFRGCLNVPSDGDYTFYLASDEGARLLVDGLTVVNNDGTHTVSELSGSVSLSAGMHPIEVQYFEREGDEVLNVSWEGPGIARTLIPTSALSVNETGISPTFRYALPQRVASDNVDGDLLDLTAEYALGQNPFTSNLNDSALHLSEGPDGILVSFDRPPGLTDFVYQLEASSDFAEWHVIAGSEVETLSNGWERVLYRHIERLAPLAPDHGFVRLKISSLSWQSTSYTPICGWYDTSFHAGYQTYGPSLTLTPVFASRVKGVVDSRLIAMAGGLNEALDPGLAYYLEITDGDYEGHRIDVIVAESTDQTVALDLSQSRNTLVNLPMEALVDHGFTIYEHTTLGGRFPVDVFHGSVSPEDADQVHFFNGTGYESYFLLNGVGGGYWTRADQSELLDANDYIVPPGVGCFVRRPEAQGGLSMRAIGHFRTNAFMQPLSKGYNLIAPSSPVEMTPATRGLSLANGFLGSRDPSTADQIQLWMADATGEGQGYLSYFLLDAGDGQAARYWTSATDSELENVDSTLRLAGDRAFFLHIIDEDHPYYRVPRLDIAP